MFTLNPQGFILHWLVSGPCINPYTPPELTQQPENQLQYEAALRALYQDGSQEEPWEDIRHGELSALGALWEYQPQGNWFLDRSAFHISLTSIRLDAVTELVCDREKTVEAVLWTYGAVDLWVNGQVACRVPKPVYKPIHREVFSLHLRAGNNRIYIQLRNLGVRDTRNIVGVQLLDTRGISGTLPDREAITPLVEADQWLAGLVCRQNVLTPRAALPQGCTAYMDTKAYPVAGLNPIGMEGREQATLCVEAAGQTLTRTFELLENIRPLHPVHDAAKEETDAMRFCRLIAQTPYKNWGENVNFSVFHVLARYALGQPDPQDHARLMADLDAVEQRVDCSDFLIMGILRLMQKYPLAEDLRLRIREVLLGFRYWMDEQGKDGMCFWSENHALMFHGAQLVAGALYPDDRFTRSGRIGREQSATGAKRCREWLADVLENGLEEFGSATYFPLTMVALLNLVDFGPEDIAQKATRCIDQLFKQLCMHIFDDACISPQGRVYRSVLYPHRQPIQALLHYFFPDMPFATGENMWSSSFVTSRYTLPKGLREEMRKPVQATYTSGNARIRVCKTPHYMLTSADCPRLPGDEPDWVNLCFANGVDTDSNAYVKSLNERFHGTTVFQPGVYGYQQHLWYAALSKECVVFANLPGSTADHDHMRPGYWHGNGVFPAVHQQGNRLGCIFEIPEQYPVSFTHLFWPAVKFEESCRRGQWLFGRCKEGMVALWCSGTLEAVDADLAQCEYRCYDRQAAYYCACEAWGGAEDFMVFQAYCLENSPSYDVKERLLSGEGGFSVRYAPVEDRSQYI